MRYESAHMQSLYQGYRKQTRAPHCSSGVLAISNALLQPCEALVTGQAAGHEGFGAKSAQGSWETPEES